MTDSSASARNAGSRALLIMAAFVVVCAGLKAASELVVPFLAAVFLAIVSIPPLAALRRAGLPKWASLAVVLVVVLGVVVLFGWIVSRSLTGFTAQLPAYQAILHRELDALAQWLRERNIDVSNETVRQQFDAVRLLGWMGDAIGAAASIAKASLFVLLTWVFIILEAAGLPDKIHRAFAKPMADFAHDRGVVQEVQHYLALKSGTNLLAGTLVWLACWSLGTPYAIAIGVFAFFMNFVPVFGPIIAAVPAVLLTLVQFGWERALLMVGLQIGLNILVGNIVEPRLFGARFGLSALVVFLSLVFWGWLLGPVGMFLSVPLTMVAKIVLANTTDFRWIAVFLGPSRDAVTSPRTLPPSRGRGADRGGTRGATGT